MSDYFDDIGYLKFKSIIWIYPVMSFIIIQ